MPMPLRKPTPQRWVSPRPHERRKIPPYRPIRPRPTPKPFHFGAPLRQHPKFGKRVPQVGFAGQLTQRGLSKLVFRAIPWVGWGLVAYELYDYWRYYKVQEWPRLPVGWYQTKFCPPYECLAFTAPTSQCGIAVGIEPLLPWRNFMGSVDTRYQHSQGWARWRYAGTWNRDTNLPREDTYIPPEWQPSINPDIAPSPWAPSVPFEFLPHRKNVPDEYEHTSPRPYLRPKDPPQIELTPNGKEQIRQNHKRRPQGKEIKGKHATWKSYEIVRNAFHGLTELQDLVEAIYKALPAETRQKAPKKMNVADRMRFIAEHYEEIDLEQMVYNIIENEIEDQIIGRGFQQLQKATNKLGVKGSGFKLYHSPLENLPQ